MKQTYIKLGERWVKGKKCPCGKMFTEEPLHHYDYAYAPEVCPKCGTGRKKFLDGAILVERGETRYIFGIKINDHWKLIEFKEF